MKTWMVTIFKSKTCPHSPSEKCCLWGCEGLHLQPKGVRWWGRFLEELHLQAQWSRCDHFKLSFFFMYMNLFSELFLSSLGDDPFLASSSYCYSHSRQGWADQVFYPKQGTSGLLPVTWLAFCSVECSLLESLFLWLFPLQKISDTIFSWKFPIRLLLLVELLI